jgi:hypothetical protein
MSVARRAIVASSMVGLWATTGWGCSSSSLPPLAGATTDSGVAVPDAPGDTGKPDGALVDAGVGDGSAGDVAEGAAPQPPPICPTTAAWGNGTALAISTGEDTFGAITPDERTIVWTSGGDAGGFTVYVADRTGPSVPFANPTVVPLAADGFVPGALAVSPDGLRVAALAPGMGFFLLTRSARGSAFGGSMTTTELATINDELSESETVDELGDPVFGQADQTFYYSRYSAAGGAIPTIFEATRTGTMPWGDGTPLSGPAVEETDAGQRRRPTGISADDRTLFYWDDATGAEMMAWRPTSTASFTTAASIGPRTGAQPNSACTAIYYSAAAGAGTGLFVAARQ